MIIRVILAGNHLLIREALEDRLSREPDFQLEVLSGNESENGRENSPDSQVVILVGDPVSMEFKESIGELRACYPSCEILVVSVSEPVPQINSVAETAVRALISTRESVDALVDAIRAIPAGENTWRDELRNRRDSHHPNQLSQRDRRTQLTRRELQVLQLIARGLSQRTIAERLAISVKTVEKHSSNLRSKLRIFDRVGLARFAIRTGLIHA